jgi:hypothetical protein
VQSVANATLVLERRIMTQIGLTQNFLKGESKKLAYALLLLLGLLAIVAFADKVFLIAAGVLGVLLYILPSLVAHKRKHSQLTAIIVLNVLLGWTMLGWVIALVWACAERSARC